MGAANVVKRICGICNKPLNADIYILHNSATAYFLNFTCVKDICIDCKIEKIKRKNKEKAEDLYKKYLQFLAE